MQQDRVQPHVITGLLGRVTPAYVERRNKRRSQDLTTFLVCLCPDYLALKEVCCLKDVARRNVRAAPVGPIMASPTGEGCLSGPAHNDPLLE
jgi:hypothetical protein